MYQLAMVPRKAVETYGERFGRHPVGTGPFVLAEEDWLPRQQMNYRRNPNYHKCLYPAEHLPEDEKLGLHLAAGQRLPLVDRLEIRMFVHPQPQWLRFRSGRLDYTTVPAEIFPDAFIKRLKQLRPALASEGITFQSERTLDFIFIGFNMEDKLLGGYTEEKKALRQALSLAMDWQERNEAFYNGLNIIYDGPIPPGLDGYPPEGVAPGSFRGPDIPRANHLLAKAGYPNGEGLPAIEYYISQGGSSQEQVEMFARHLARIGVKIQPRQVDFSTLISNVAKRKAPMFSFAWGSDYPDAENNLALFYSPNASPGSNHYNYKNPAYDKLYEQIRSLAPSPERTKIYEQMRDMVIEDAPYLGSMARENYYLISPRLKNMKATDIFNNWYKYLDVEEAGAGD
jgi:oligopeptide transport system substrate-binding protein